jgi:hypothetical protein
VLREDAKAEARRVNKRIRKAREDAETFGDGTNLAYIGALERHLTECENANVLLMATNEGLLGEVAALEHLCESLQEQLEGR